MSKVIIAFWLVFLTTLSLAPYDVKLRLGTNGRFHELGHLAIFAVTSVIVCWAAATARQMLPRFLAICCFAILMEALETAIYRNAYEWRDVGVDVLGAALGVFCALMRTNYRSTRYSSGTKRTA